MVLTACKSAELPCDTITPCEGDADEEALEVGAELLDLVWWCFECVDDVDEGEELECVFELEGVVV